MTEPTPEERLAKIPGTDRPRPNYNSRLVVINQITHGRITGKETQADGNYQRFLKSNEQAYGPRELIATTTWQKVDCGWLTKCSTLLIINTSPSKNIDDKEVFDNTLEITTASPPSSTSIWILLPGESFRGCPANLASLHIRCRNGQVPFTITVFPE